jgi:hypothetical protein
MRQKSTFSVEPIYDEGGRQRSGELIHVDAEGPTQAAEKALGVPVSQSGTATQLRARVWWLDDQFRTVSMPVYDSERGASARAPVKRR